MKGRIQFLRPNGEPGKRPAHGQTVFYFGADIEAFERAFASFGTITVARGSA